MFPAAFDYHKPKSLDEAVALLASLGDDVKLLAGGHSLIPTLKLRLSQPQHLIDLSGIPGLDAIAVEDSTLVLGAMATHWQVESSPVVGRVLPYLSKVAGQIADPQVRNRGTIGGSLANADPAADYPASIVALDAELVCTSGRGIRTVPAAEWFLGLMTTALAENEILTAIRIPLLPPRTAATYLKLPHPASRFAVAGVAAIVTVAPDGTCADVRIGVTGIASHAMRAAAVEQRLLGQPLAPALIAEASELACTDMEIDGDMHFSANDKRQLCCVQVKRALLDIHAMGQAGAFQPARPADVR